MKLTLRWLKQFIDLGDASIDAIAAALTSLGMEVENITPAINLDSFIIAEAVECNKHPNADALNVCKVSTGDKTFNVVCGGKNVRAGLKIVYSPVGTRIPATGMVIKKIKLRGEESEGMICSGFELGFGEDSGDIIELEQSASVGKKFIDEYPWASDTVIEIGVTPNRSDWLGVYGIARDLAAYGLGQLHSPQINEGRASETSPIKLQVADENACPLFIGRYIASVDNSKHTEDSLKALMHFIGEKSISPIVDITNYINYSFCRPMHAYDADKIKGVLQVRFAKNDEKMLPLGANEDGWITLADEDLVVADEEKICALAGVIGDERSKCTDKTTNILLEAAVFRSDLVYKTGRRHGINTDSRYRFERGVDFNYTEQGLLIASQLMQEHCGGSCGDIVKLGKPFEEKSISFDCSKVSKLIGIDLPEEKILKILESLGFKCSSAAKGLVKVSVPSWRNDVTIAEDLVEEVARINGYDNIPAEAMPDLQSNNLKYVQLPQINKLLFNVRSVLAASGYDEIITWSFMPSKLAESFGMLEKSLVITNPLSAEMDVMRASLLPNLLSCVVKNNARSFKNLSLFEVGNVFDKAGKQAKILCGMRSGQISEESIYKDSRAFDFFDVKADVLKLLTEIFNMKAADLSFESEGAGSCYHPTQSAMILFKGGKIGQVGVLHPRVLKFMDIKQPTVAFEIYLDQLNDQGRSKLLSTSDYQSVERDFAFVVGKEIAAQQLIDAARAGDSSGLIKKIVLFDVFQSEDLGQDKKSIAFRIIFQAEDHTLTAEEIEKFSQGIMASVREKIPEALLRDLLS